MKKILIIIFLIFFSSSVFAEFIMQPVNCTIKKSANCGAYIYNTKTGLVYFCSSEECKEVKTPIEVFIEYEDEDSESSILPKKKKSKIPKKPKKKESKIPKKPKKKESEDDKCKKSKIPKPGCTKKSN